LLNVFYKNKLFVSYREYIRLNNLFDLIFYLNLLIKFNWFYFLPIVGNCGNVGRVGSVTPKGKLGNVGKVGKVNLVGTEMVGNVGIVIEGTVMDGTVIEGIVIEGTVIDGTVIKGTVIDGTVGNVICLIGLDETKSPVIFWLNK